MSGASTKGVAAGAMRLENVPIECRVPSDVPAVVLRFIAIGEATKQIPVGIIVRRPEIEWQKIAGIRDISVHSLDAVKPTVSWDIIQTTLLVQTRR